MVADLYVDGSWSLTVWSVVESYVDGDRSQNVSQWRVVANCTLIEGGRWSVC